MSNNFKYIFRMNSTNQFLKQRGLLPGGIVQKYVDSEVLRCSDPYVPFQSGMLKKSGRLNTVIGSGTVKYHTPYARKVYYENKGNGIQGLNRGGLRGRLFFERMKTDHKIKILKGAKRYAGSR